MTLGEGAGGPGRRLRILNLISGAHIGGHIISARTISEALLERGHNVVVAGGRGHLEESFKERGIRFHVVHDPTRVAHFTFALSSFRTVGELRRLLSSERFDIIHAYDVAALLNIRLAHPQTTPPTVATLCGGAGPRWNVPPVHKLFVFSAELRSLFIERWSWPPGRVVVLPHRIRTDLIERGEDSSAWARSLGLERECPQVVMISRLTGPKSLAVNELLNAIPLVASEFPQVEFVVVGGGDALESLRRRGEEVNAQINKRVVRFVGPVREAGLVVRRASVVGGVGRSLYEAMARSKPCLVVGEHGFAGEVSEANIAELEYYNFSGRNCTRSRHRTALAEAILKLLRDPSYAGAMGDFGRRYVQEKLDVRVGAAKLEEFYYEAIATPMNGSAGRVLGHCLRLAGMYLIQAGWRQLRYRRSIRANEESTRRLPTSY